VPGVALDHGVQLADGFVERSLIEQHAAEGGARLEIVGLDLDGPPQPLFGVLVLEEIAIHAAQVEGRLAVVGVRSGARPENSRRPCGSSRRSLVVKFQALVELLNGGARAAAHDQNLERDGDLLPG